MLELSCTPTYTSTLYPDIYKHYRWDKNKWVKRRAKVRRNYSTDEDSNDGASSDMIGRIPVINLNACQSELYFLRMLLYHKPGAMCFDDSAA